MAMVNYPENVSIPNQIRLQRQNLINVCRFVVKSITDNVYVVPIDEGSQDLHNLFAVLEQLFSHRLKPIINWYGGPEQRYFWDFIKVACKCLPRNCLETVDSMNQPRTSLGKGRAWIRMCLMEKRLCDYVQAALHSHRTLETFFEEDSVMLSEESGILSDILLGLNIIDFSFDIKGTYLDFPWFLAINYSRYLKFTLLLNDTGQSASQEQSQSTTAESGNNGYANELEKTRSHSVTLTDQLKVTIEQKRYLDELLRLRELQIEDLSSERRKMLEMIQEERLERDKEKTQFESIIFELQSQLFHLREQSKGLMRKWQRESETSSPGVLMSHLLTREVQEELKDGEKINEEVLQPSAAASGFEMTESFEQPLPEVVNFLGNEEEMEEEEDSRTVNVELEKKNFEEVIKA